MGTVVVAGTTFRILDSLDPGLFKADESVIASHWMVGRGSICMDVGFGPGTWSLVAMARGAKVFSFDPKPDAIELLRAQMALNGFSTGHLLPFGLWHEDAILPMCDSSFKWEGEVMGTFPVTTLDRFLDGIHLRGIDCINMDVEAAELEVLRGARRTIARYKPKVIVEVHRGVSREAIEASIPHYKWSFYKETFMIGIDYGDAPVQG